MSQLARSPGLGFLVLILSGYPMWASAGPLLLRPAEPVNAGAGPLDMEAHAIPCAADWNGDGLKDLLVGYQNAGKIALFLNSGTATQPIFTGYANLQVGGADLYHPSGGCGAPAPWVCDYDGDGKRDLVVGDGNNGTVYCYRNTNTDQNPILTTKVPLLVSGSPLSVSSRATPYIHDWDEDGLPDLLCGAGDGLIYWFRNLGSAQAPAYAPATTLQAGGIPLSLGARSVVRIFDWDSDGRKDVVCSGTGSGAGTAGWCRNTGSNPSPVLEALAPLQCPAPNGTLIPIQTGYRMRLELADWNNDGVMDMLMGNADGTLFCYEGYRLAFTSLTFLSDNMFTLQWHSASYLKYHLLGGNSLANLHTVLATDVPSGGKLTTWTDYRQGPWQFFLIQQGE